MSLNNSNADPPLMNNSEMKSPPCNTKFPKSYAPLFGKNPLSHPLVLSTCQYCKKNFFALTIHIHEIECRDMANIQLLEWENNHNNIENSTLGEIFDSDDEESDEASSISTKNSVKNSKYSTDHKFSKKVINKNDKLGAKPNSINNKKLERQSKQNSDKNKKAKKQFNDGNGAISVNSHISNEINEFNGNDEGFNGTHSRKRKKVQEAFIQRKGIPHQQQFYRSMNIESLYQLWESNLEDAILIETKASFNNNSMQNIISHPLVTSLSNGWKVETNSNPIYYNSINKEITSKLNPSISNINLDSENEDSNHESFLNSNQNSTTNKNIFLSKNEETLNRIVGKDLENSLQPSSDEFSKRNDLNLFVPSHSTHYDSENEMNFMTTKTPQKQYMSKRKAITLAKLQKKNTNKSLTNFNIQNEVIDDNLIENKIQKNQSNRKNTIRNNSKDNTIASRLRSNRLAQDENEENNSNLEDSFQSIDSTLEKNSDTSSKKRPLRKSIHTRSSQNKISSVHDINSSPNQTPNEGQLIIEDQLKENKSVDNKISTKVKYNLRTRSKKSQ